MKGKDEFWNLMMLRTAADQAKDEMEDKAIELEPDSACRFYII